MKALLAVAGLAAVLVAAPAAGAAPAAARGPGSLSGVWRMTGYKGSTYPPRERIARDLQGRLPPLLPAAREVLEKRVSEAEAGRLFANTAVFCLPQGIPYMLFAAVDGPIQILETPGQVTLISEEFNEIWFIRLGASLPALDDIPPSFHGESTGRWEGDTLVVETLGLTERTTLDQVGMPHSDQLKVTTRIRRTDAATLDFQVAMDDPKTFSAPWSRRVVYKRAPAGEYVREYVCDHNRNLPDAEGLQGFQLPRQP